VGESERQYALERNAPVDLNIASWTLTRADSIGVSIPEAAKV